MRVKKTRILAQITRDHAVVHFTVTHLRELPDVQRIVDEIEAVVAQHKVPLVVLNFSRLQQMTSAFLSKLISLNKTLRQSEVALRLCGMNPEVERAFRICKLEKVIPLFATEDEALLP